MLKVLRQPSQLPDMRQRLSVGLAIGLVVFLILAFLQPFGTAQFTHRFKILLLAGYGFIIGGGYLLPYWLAKTFFPNWYQAANWNLIREISMGFLVSVFLLIATYFYNLFITNSQPSLRSFLFYSRTVGLILLFLFSLFVLGVILVRQFISPKENSKELANAPKPTLRLTGENQNEEIVVFQHELLYLKAADNYVEVVLFKNQQTEKHLLRSSLRRMSELVDANALIKTHRSYLVNVEMVQQLVGKSPDYRLVLTNEEELPLSRGKVKEVRAFLRQRPV